MAHNILKQKMDQVVYNTWNGLRDNTRDQLMIYVGERIWVVLRRPVRDLIFDVVQARVIDELRVHSEHTYGGGRPGPALKTVAHLTMVRLVATGTRPLAITRRYRATGKYIPVGTEGRVMTRRWNEDRGVYQYIVKFYGHSTPRCVDEQMLELYVSKFRE